MVVCSNFFKSHAQIVIYRKKMKLYSVILVIMSKIRQFADYVAVSIMGNGLLIDVMANYVVIKMYGRVPFLLYLSIGIIAILVPIIMMAELPAAALTLVASEEVIHTFNKRMSRSKLQRKIVNSLMPAKIVVGLFFKVGKSTTATYVNIILSYTITAIISY